MNDEKMKIKPIFLTHQPINDYKLKIMMQSVYRNIIFSTFPYHSYKLKSSKDAYKIYNSGNCIALAMFCKDYLMSNYDIKSYIIPASVPNSYKVEGTPHACHCALLIPINNNEFYIFDPAFNNLSCMYCNLNDNIKRKTKCSDIYSHTPFDIEYDIQKCDTSLLDVKFNQEILHNSIKVSCHFDFDSSQIWNYYLVEIENPDESIGVHFLRAKSQPFILYTIYDSKANIVKLKYKMRMDEIGNMIVTKYPEKKEVYNDLYDSNHEVFNEVGKYLDKYI